MKYLRYIAIGLIGGVLSGAFGVGGGIVMVPLLVAIGGFDQRRASAVSLLAILPAALVGTITYLAHGEVDVLAGVVIAVGAVIGSIVGSHLLKRLPLGLLSWLFIALVVVTAVRLLLVTPERAAPAPVSVGTVFVYIAIGLFMGLCSGLFGIGGGVIAVPALVALVGVSDLVAKGTSLLAMIPTSAAGTITHYRNGITDVRAGAVVGVAAAAASFPGALIALALSPRLSTVLFAVLLLAVAVQLTVKALRR